MENEMLLIRKLDITELNKNISKLTEVLTELNLTKQEEKFFTRDEAQEYYKFSKREVDKVYNTILKDKVVDIGKCQRLAKVHIDKMLTEGIKMKYV